MKEDKSVVEDNLTVTRDTFDAYLKYIEDFSSLEKEEIYNLGLEAMRGSDKAKEKLMLHHLKFVVYIAKPFFSIYPSIEPLDIVQYGNEGLIKAIDRFYPRDGALTTYAGPWIKQEIVRGINRDHANIRLPEDINIAKRKYQRILRNSEQKGKAIPSDRSLCKTLGVSSDTLEIIKVMVSTTFVSMDMETDDDKSQVKEFIRSDKASLNPENVIFPMDMFMLLVAIKEVLDPKLYYIIYMRFFSNDKWTLEEVGKALDVTRECIRQLEAIALEKIKPLLENDYKKVNIITKKVKSREKAKFYKINVTIHSHNK